MRHALVILFAPALGIGGGLALLTWMLLDSSEPFMERLPVMLGIGAPVAIFILIVDVIALICGA